MSTKFGVLGVGQVGMEHVKAILKTDNAELSAIADIDKSKGKEVTQKKKTVQYFKDYQDLLDSDLELDAIINCLPHDMHYQSSLEVAQRGLHTLLEKPICLSLENADRLIEIYEDNDLKLSISFVHRFRTEMLEAKRLLDEGVIGKPATLMDNFCSQGGKYVPGWVWDKNSAGGGVLMYGGIHALDRILWFLDEMPFRVYAQSQTYSQKTDCEDGLVSILEFDSGVQASLFENSPGFLTVSRWETEVFGSKGMMRINFGEGIEVSTDRDHYVRDYERYDHFKRQLEDFLNAIENNSTPWITGKDGKRSLVLAKKIYESARTGERIEL